MNRAITYLALVNSAMILFLTLSKLKEVGLINFEIDKYFIPIYVLGGLILIIFGWFDVKFFKGLQGEARKMFDLNPRFNEMNNRLSRIEERLKC